MVILFEDGETSAISQLLKNSYYGNKILFLHGATNIRRTLMEQQERFAQENFILIFLDVVPDNPYTVRDYYDVIETACGIRGKAYKEACFVVPIFCIEYVLLRYVNFFLQDIDLHRFLTEYKIPYNLTSYDAVRGEDNSLLVRKNTLASFENRCKAVLEYLSNPYFPKEGAGAYPYLLNISLRKRCKQLSGYSCFYYKDCDACTNSCKLRSSGDLHWKSNMLYTHLPVFMTSFPFEVLLGRTFEPQTWVDVVERQQSLYDALFAEIEKDWAEKHVSEPCEFTRFVIEGVY